MLVLNCFSKETQNIEQMYDWSSNVKYVYLSYFMIGIIQCIFGGNKIYKCCKKKGVWNWAQKMF
jgi:hypothetical protein